MVENAEPALPSNNQQTQSQSEGTKAGGKEFVMKNLFEKGYYDYQGKMREDMVILMSLYPQEKDIVGSYFYENEREETTLKGKAEGTKIILFEYDDKGQKTGSFIGTMETVDRIEGIWTSADGKMSYPFALSLSSILPGAEYGKRYAVAVSNASDQEVENYAGTIQDYIMNSEKKLSKEMQYPINVKIDGKVSEIKNQDEFIKNYDKIFSPGYKQSMSHAFTKYMFANWQGVMFGSGMENMWINEVKPAEGSPKLMITAINN